MDPPQPKKRGRKPKIQKVLLNTEDNKKINSDDENIILYLPITQNDVNNDIFINTSNENIKKHTIDYTCSNSSDIITTITKNNFINKSINKINTYCIHIDKNTKCWWCKHIFDFDNLQLPENYIKGAFYCIGTFCSFNCMKSYNFDINDNLSEKRNTLINLLYFMTFNKHINIMQAPHWLTLKDFGGPLSIEEFRLNSINGACDYLVLLPPLISKEIQIEESYKKNSNTSQSISNKHNVLLNNTVT